MAVTRKIVHIDEDKCDGCGQCVPSCAEGAIRILDGKARLVSDKYCDGLGACLGHCPRDAISIIEREAPLFDEHATHSHLAALRECEATRNGTGGCPGAAVKDLRLNVLSNGPPMPAASGGAPATANNVPSRLGNWPLQLPLVPPQRAVLARGRPAAGGRLCARRPSGFSPPLPERPPDGHGLSQAGQRGSTHPKTGSDHPRLGPAEHHRAAHAGPLLYRPVAHRRSGRGDGGHARADPRHDHRAGRPRIDGRELTAAD